MITKGKENVDLRKRIWQLIDFKKNRNKWKLEKHKSTKDKDNLTDDFRLQLDQLNEVTNNILSKNFLMQDEGNDDYLAGLNEENFKHNEKSARNLYSDDSSNLIDFNSWQDKMKLSNINLKPVQQVDPEDNDDYRLVSELRIKPENVDGSSGSKRAFPPLKIKKKDIITKTQNK